SLAFAVVCVLLVMRTQSRRYEVLSVRWVDAGTGHPVENLTATVIEIHNKLTTLENLLLKFGIDITFSKKNKYSCPKGELQRMPIRVSKKFVTIIDCSASNYSGMFVVNDNGIWHCTNQPGALGALYPTWPVILSSNGLLVIPMQR